MTVVVIAVTFLVAISFLWYLNQTPNPYIEQVLSLSGNINRGQEMFEVNCAVCHGVEADGNVGPSLHHVSQRKSRVKLIEQVISGNTPPMPKFQPNSQEMADLLSYLETL